MFMAWCLTILSIAPSDSSKLITWRAKDPFTLRWSETRAVVMYFILGISCFILANFSSVKYTALSSFSLTLPLLHFFFLAPPALAAAAFFSLVAPALGGMSQTGA